MPFGDGEWCDRMRRQRVTHGFDGPVSSSLEGDASSPSPLLHHNRPGYNLMSPESVALVSGGVTGG